MIHFSSSITPCQSFLRKCREGKRASECFPGGCQIWAVPHLGNWCGQSSMKTILSQQNFLLISGKGNKLLIWRVKNRRQQSDSGGATGVSFLIGWDCSASSQGQRGCLAGLTSLLVLWFAPAGQLSPRGLHITVLEWMDTKLKGKSSSFLGWCLVLLWVSK